MAFPWSRRGSTRQHSDGGRSGREGQPRDRRLRRSPRPNQLSRESERRPRVLDRRRQRASPGQEAKRQKVAIILGIAIILTVIGIVGYGYFDKFIAPPRVLAAQIRDTVYTQGDLLKRVRLIRNSQGTVDLSTAPFQILNDIVSAELIRQGAPYYQVLVTDEDVESLIKINFFPNVLEGQDVDPGQIDREYKEAYRTFLNAAQISDREYRVLVEDIIYRSFLREALGEQIPGELEHVEVNWIFQPTEVTPDPQNPPPTPIDIMDRLKAEEFHEVAGEVSRDSRFDNDGDGYVGWVPIGAFPDLDKALFGTEEEPLVIGRISDPIYIEGGVYILQVIAGPEERLINPGMKEQLKDSTLDEWVGIQRNIGAREGWLEVNFNSELYAWVAEQIKRSAPPGGVSTATPGAPAGLSIPAP
jgi:parvulin-like peptidyl-prolyl isomerase